MVYIKINSPLKDFLISFEKHFKVKFFNQKFQTKDLVELNNNFIKLQQLREYVDLWNNNFNEIQINNNSDNQQEININIKNLFNIQDIYQTIEFKLLQDEASLTEQQKINSQLLYKRQQERQYQKQLIGNTQKKGIFGGENVKDIEKSMSFGISFIFTLFLSSLSGFYFGKHIMGWPEIYSLVLALIVCILTMIMEIVLFIIKIDRKDKNERYFSKSIEKMEKKKVWELNNKKKN